MMRLLLLLSLLVPVADLAQSSQNAKPSDSATAASESRDLAKIFFTVKDKDNHNTLIPDLPQTSFQVLEDGRPQTIKEFASPATQPLTIGVLVESSGALQGALSIEKGAAAEFLHQVLGKPDLAFVISFDLTVDLLQDLTSDIHLLREGLDRAHTNTRGGSGRGRILMHDAIYLAADEVLRAQVGRKALVIFTSGLDYGSKIKLPEVIEVAQKTDTTCYVIYFGRAPLLGARADEVSEATGGRLFSVNSSEKLIEALAQITRELRNQYYIGYASDSTAQGLRKLEISSKEGHKVQVRKGYYGR
jgi:VWFA-related protein